jgi:hypothetical protein
MEPHVDLFIYFAQDGDPEGAYIKMLSIPRADCLRFALKPLKWLLYLCYVVYGHEGVLRSTGEDGALVEVAYNGELRSKEYFFRANGTYPPPIRLTLHNIRFHRGCCSSNRRFFRCCRQSHIVKGNTTTGSTQR